MADRVVVEAWGESHPRWPELLDFVDALDQTRWATIPYEWAHSSHILVALSGTDIAGFLRFVVQGIGAEDDHDPVTMNGRVLTEAKVLAFGVSPRNRRQGIGRSMQKALLDHAGDLGCYQVRSHSSGENIANHRLKLSMGYAVHPVIRGEDRGGVYFVKVIDSPA
jgi:GNAT superfamily N-acetyltransferase